ncbi:AbrB family transcriptional regulator [Falsiroseomonas stagni]|uniref:AbrB family transcriptional regulator n=1 Tax=Falsiroseomonas stagni TaxID=484882 RepID=UPI000B857436|nr:AbrB family transcriptional regulator [Falsiroseomonas stagni]
MRWAWLIAFSVLLGASLAWLRVPAALLLGPLVVAAVMAICGAACVVPARLFKATHAVVGLLIARSLSAGTLVELLKDWPLFLAGVLFVVAASSGIGWLLARWAVLPGTTAVWGAAPGAATAMIIMAGSQGADVRLVAFMQYLRLVMAVVVATIVAGWWTGLGVPAANPASWLVLPDLTAFAATLLVAAVGLFIAARVSLPMGSLLIPMMLGAVMGNSGLVTIELPPWLLAPTYAVVGWQVGSRFDRPIVLHAMRALPGLLAGTVALVALCAGFAALLVVFAGIDPLTAYLATSPGGIDSVAIIGMAGGADMAFVMAMQTARFLFVMATGPWIARAVANSIARR